uniref:Putative secreted protein n=1 Tax=Ixodes ricinus TaxID=34613 RepID=A0A6B0UA14_IXORI
MGCLLRMPSLWHVPVVFCRALAARARSVLTRCLSVIKGGTLALEALVDLPAVPTLQSASSSASFHRGCDDVRKPNSYWLIDKEKNE